MVRSLDVHRIGEFCNQLTICRFRVVTACVHSIRSHGTQTQSFQFCQPEVDDRPILMQKRTLGDLVDFNHNSHFVGTFFVKLNQMEFFGTLAVLYWVTGRRFEYSSRHDAKIYLIFQ